MINLNGSLCPPVSSTIPPITVFAVKLAPQPYTSQSPTKYSVDVQLYTVAAGDDGEMRPDLYLRRIVKNNVANRLTDTWLDDSEMAAVVPEGAPATQNGTDVSGSKSVAVTLRVLAARARNQSPGRPVPGSANLDVAGARKAVVVFFSDFPFCPLTVARALFRTR